MREVVIIGAGIVGVSLARELALRAGLRVTVIDRDAIAPHGSTTFAPGFVGHYNDAPILLDLARLSVAAYLTAGAGFHQIGGLELATSDQGAVEIERRCTAARAAGLTSRMVDPALVRDAVPFVNDAALVAAALCTDDAVADPVILRSALKAQAEARGARFVNGTVVAVTTAGPAIRVITTDGAVLTADDVVLAGGIWGRSLAGMVDLSLPLVPVAHPYVYSASDARWRPGPFVRWPEHHVYARVHGDQLGIGSYDHRPVAVTEEDVHGGANLEWNRSFGEVIAGAQQLLLPFARFDAARHINGVFAMTPDNLPFLGAHPDVAGLWIAQAIWVTHAAGSARRLAAAMLDGEALPTELAIDRFAGRPADALREAALRLYRDIYANDGVSEGRQDTRTA